MKRWWPWEQYSWGLPLVSALPSGWPSVVIDIKDCFFSIPLHPEDTQCFAFTVPTINHSCLDQHYEWVVLPQGMANSPTMCQLYVDQALKEVRTQFPPLIGYHYMDDLLLCHKKEQYIEKALSFPYKHFEKFGLHIAPEEVQMTPIKEYLGTRLENTKVRPLKITLRMDHLNTLNDFQKLLRDINCHPYLRHLKETLTSPLLIS